MEMMLQFGFGMMEHTRVLLRAWGGGTVILSPRDLEPEQVWRFARDVELVPGGRAIFDPQFYLPNADHERLTSHAYWPANYQSGAFWQGRELEDLLTALGALNTRIGAAAVILPGPLAATVDDDWLGIQTQILSVARRLLPGRSLYASVALGADAVRSQSQVEELLEASDTWDVDGFYLVAEHPQGDYLVEDPNWLAGLLDVTAHQRLSHRVVLCGYSTHQMLMLAAAGASAVASGTWMNVRSFPPGKFDAAREEEIRQRATWYYCPEALSEYKLPYLDIAQRAGILPRMRADAGLGSNYADTVFAGGQPSASGFDEPAAFRHYLQCLRSQAVSARAPTYDATRDLLRAQLDTAENLLMQLRAAGVLGQMRDFADSIDANRSALALLDSTRGPVLRRNWPTL
jgi:hypothetical protein